MSFLDSVLSKLKSGAMALDESSASVIGVDMGSSSIKVVQLRKEKGQALLETYGQISLSSYAGKELGQAANADVDTVAKALLDLIKEANITTTDAGASIPFSYAFSKIIRVPKVSDSQLKKIIPLEARKYVPMSLNEVSLNWIAIPEQETINFLHSSSEEAIDNESKIDFIEVLLVAVHNDAVSKIQNIIKFAGLNSTFYELGAFSAARSILDFEILPHMLVDIAATNTKVYIVESGILRFSYLINFGSKNITENISRALNVNFASAERIKREQGWVSLQAQVAGVDNNEASRVNPAIESVLSRIFTEINRVVISYEKRYGKTIKQIHFLGGGANMPGLVDYANSKLNIEATLADSFSKIKAPAFLEPVLKDLGPDFAIANGLALRKLGL